MSEKADRKILPGITTPEEFFGFRLGSDRKIARWDKIVEYLYKLEKESDRIKNIDMGETTLGNPFLLTIISAPENLQNLDKLKEINKKITDPRGVPEETIKELIKEGKAVVCQSMSLHATEIGGTQMAPELAYDLIAVDSQANRDILENVIFLMVPSFNPDGQIMVTDWYNKYVGTEYEGTGLPWLYHTYAGHDNNRDAFALNLVESQYLAKIVFQEWHPHSFQDHHQMGSNGARLYLAPYSDAIRPYADPLVWREDSWYGAHMAYTLEQQGKTGVLNAAQFSGWGHFGFHWITTHHNIAGMLTEAASTRLATPIYIHPHQLRGASRKTMPEYEAQTNFPHPWPGGWWRLRDIVEYMKIAAWALLDVSAQFKEKVLWNAYLKAKRQTERGAEGKPYGYVISARQHDPLTALKLVELLLAQGVEVKRAKAPFQVDHQVFPEGSYVISLAQPKMGVIRSLLGRTFYPDSYWTRNPDGSPIMYDTATDTVGEFMGVDVRPLDDRFSGDFEVIRSVTRSCCEGECEEVRKGAGAPAGYLIDPRLNDGFIAVNRLLAKGASVWRFTEPVLSFPHGAFFVENDPDIAETLSGIGEIGVPLCPVLTVPDVPKREVKTLRVGMYQRYMGGNMDEGWTRLVFDRFEFPYTSLKDEHFKDGDLIEKFDVIVFPQDRAQMIIGKEAMSQDPRMRMWRMAGGPPEFESGIGKDGVKALKKFVQDGGRLVAIDSSSEFAIEACDLRVRNSASGLTFKDYYCQGSTLHVNVDNAHPVAYGMPQEALILNMRAPVLEITDYSEAHNYEVVASYRDRDLLQSGWLIGEERLVNRPCVIKAKLGKGEVILFGFRPQFRAQTHGTFKLLFNCLV